MVLPCWTVTHLAPKPLPRLAQALRSATTHVHRHGIRKIRHAVSHPTAWVETVCRAVPFVIAPAILTVPIPADPPSAMPFVHLQITPADTFVFAPPAGPSTLITLRHNNAPPPPDADIILAPYVIPAPSKPVKHPDQPKTVVSSLITQIPETAPMTLLGVGLSAILLLRRKRGFAVPPGIAVRG